VGELTPTQILLADPLSEVARKERRSLLVAAAVGIVIAKTRLVPTKISTLGIEFSETDKSSLILIVAAVVVYFAVAFIIYAWSDFAAWRVNLYDAQFESLLAAGLAQAPGVRIRDREREKFDHRKRHFYAFIARPAYYLRAVFDFLIPIVVGAYSFVCLIHLS
jgi:hypothetical protein